MFPKIPEADLESIISHAFEKVSLPYHDVDLLLTS
jgi:hypothetical protein